MSIPFRTLAVATLAVALVFACYTGPSIEGAPGGVGGGGGSVAPSGCSATLASIQEKVFLAKCASAGCHGASKPASGLDLISAGVEARLVGVPSTCADHLLVAPGNPDASLLVDKLVSAEPTCGGDRMPVDGVLDEADVACVKTWIASLPADAGGGVDAGPTVNCGVGETACGSTCKLTATDPANCGACGNVCSGAAKFCVNGACSASCPLTDCSGACVDTQTDAANCGGCGKACTGGKVCVAGACSCGTSSTTLASIQAATFTPSCTGAGCHSKVGQKAPAEGLDLSSAALAYQTMVGKASSTCAGRTRVVAGDVAASYLMNKLTGVSMCNGSKMPKGAGLSAAEIDAVRNWICSGAKPN